jgi:hypothetical protein
VLRIRRNLKLSPFDGRHYLKHLPLGSPWGFP